MVRQQKEKCGRRVRMLDTCWEQPCMYAIKRLVEYLMSDDETQLVSLAKSNTNRAHFCKPSGVGTVIHSCIVSSVLGSG